MTLFGDDEPVTPQPAVGWKDLERHDARLRSDQVRALQDVVRDLKEIQGDRGESGSTPRITVNTTLRMAVDLLVAHHDRLLKVAITTPAEEGALMHALLVSLGSDDDAVERERRGDLPVIEPTGAVDDEPGVVEAAPAPYEGLAPLDDQRSSRAAHAVRKPSRGGAGGKQRREPSAAAASVSRGARFAAVAGVLTADALHLPGGRIVPWHGGHIGEVALLGKEQHLGWGGSAEVLPERGEIWIYPDALERLGLPVTIDIDPMATRTEQRRIADGLFAALNEVPAVADALAQGWVLGNRAGTMERRTRISHPERHRAGAHLVPVTWTSLQNWPPLITDRAEDAVVLPAPGTLADRLQEFATRTGIAYRISPAVTGLDLIDHTKPPLTERRQTAPGARLTAGVPAELPPWMPGRAEAWHTQVEGALSWSRRWDQLAPSEREHTYVHAYDHRSHYLNPWGGTYLGLTGLRHLQGQEDARWRGDERAAYYRVTKWTWDTWAQPDPAKGLYAFEERTVWVTPYTLKLLDRLSDGPFSDSLTYHEAWTWDVQDRYLSKAGGLLRDARNQGSSPVADTVKEIYSATTQKFAEVDHRPNYHLWRPDWRDMIIGASKLAIASVLTRAAPASLPLVVDRDTIIFASDDPNPDSAWPGDPAKYGAIAGGWRPIGSARLEQWGPSALERRVGLWPYARHVGAMCAPGQADQEVTR